jgi:hypothetical protein
MFISTNPTTSLIRFLKDKGFPREMQHSIRSSIEYQWMQTQHKIEDALFGDLPPQVRTEIASHLLLSLIESTPLFQNSDQEFKVALCKTLKLYTIPEGQVLFKAGEEGSGM